MCTRETFHQFVADVAGLQVGKNKYVGFAGYRAARGFVCAYFGHERGIGLQFAVDLQCRRFLFNQTCGFGYLVDEFVLGAAFG